MDGALRRQPAPEVREEEGQELLGAQRACATPEAGKGLGSGQTQVDDPQADDMIGVTPSASILPPRGSKVPSVCPPKYCVRIYVARCWVMVFAMYWPSPGATWPASPATLGGPGRNSCASIWGGGTLPTPKPRSHRHWCCQLLLSAYRGHQHCPPAAGRSPTAFWPLQR